MSKMGIRLFSHERQGIYRMSAGNAKAIAINPPAILVLPRIFTKTYNHPKLQWWIGFFMIVLLLSTFAIIYVKDINRRLNGELQQVEAQKEELRNYWSQLLLEESAWANQARVEQVAAEQYSMVVPSAKSAVLVG